jgi:hypothetical protein
MNHEILFADEVCEHFRIHRQTLKLWLMQARAGISDFPLPVSPFGKKLRWRREDILDYQSRIGNERAKPASVSPAKRAKRQAQVMRELEELNGKKK